MYILKSGWVIDDYHNRNIWMCIKKENWGVVSDLSLISDLS